MDSGWRDSVRSHREGHWRPWCMHAAYGPPPGAHLLGALITVVGAFAKAKAEGKYRQRAPIARSKTDQIRELAKEGLTKGKIAERLVISGLHAVSPARGSVQTRSVFRVLAMAR